MISFRVLSLLAFLQFTILTLGFSQSLTVELTPSFSIDKQILFGNGTEALFAPDGLIVIGDPSQSRFTIVDMTGALIRQFGSKGRGPGDIGHLTSFSLSASDKSIYLLDMENQRIEIHPLQIGRPIKTYEPGYPIRFPHRIYSWNESIVITGYHPENNQIAHIHNRNSMVYSRSVGNMISWDNTGIRFINEMIKSQLNTGVFAASHESYFVASNAPYILEKYSARHQRLWRIEDPILPKPWINHIEVTPLKYRVDFYPSILSLHSISRDHLLVHWLDTKGDRSEWTYWIDLRSARNGSLIERMKLPFKGFITDARTVGGRTSLLVRDQDTFEIRMYRLNR